MQISKSCFLAYAPDMAAVKVLAEICIDSSSDLECPPARLRFLLYHSRHESCVKTADTRSQPKRGADHHVCTGRRHPPSTCARNLQHASIRSPRRVLLDCMEFQKSLD